MNSFRIRCLAALITCCVVSVSWSGQDKNEDMQLKEMAESQVRTKLQKHRALKGSGQENRGLIRKYRLELAKRGDKSERRSLFAELKSKDLAEQSRALEDVAQLGDKEAIAQLGAMLDDPSEGGRYTRDQAFLPPRMVAAMKLAQKIENPPVPPIGAEKKFYVEDDVKKWQKWWKKNKKQYGVE